MFDNMRVLIWDFDGTLYPPNPKLWQAVRESEYRVIMECRGWTRERAIEEFNKYYKNQSPSATQTVGFICGLKTDQAAEQMEKHYDRRDFLVRDEKLIGMFGRLKSYRHFILANGVKHRIEQTLAVLGIDKSIFERIVTSELSGENKPSEVGFRYILNYTKLPADQHLMIGDREMVDLAPAKKLGMKTCLVFSDERSEVADVTLRTVYDLPDIF